jgi:hypothetical protein
LESRKKNGNTQKEGKHLEIFNKKKTILSLHQNILNSIYCSTQNKFVCVVKQKKRNRYNKKIDIRLFLISGNLSQFVRHNLKRQRTNVR